MNMKPSALIELKRNTVTQERDTIERRVNALGLTEPTVQDYGASDTQSEILVELPGVDDPARVKELIGSAAQLKIVEVKNEGPWKTREEGLAAKGGILPLGTEMLDWPAGIGNGSGAWYLVSRTPVITGQDMRNARAAHGFRIRPDDGSALSLCRRMAAASSALSPAPTSATAWRWCWTTRSPA